MKKCKNCHIKIDGRGEFFCSKSCVAQFNNRKRKKHNICLNCSSPTEAYKKCCSVKCSFEYKNKIIFERIEKGDTTLFFKQYKKYLIFKHGAKCMECGWCEVNPVTGLIPIQLEHIDGNSDNNSLENLKLLCPNHHSLTPTFGSLNKNGKISKRKKYRKDYRKMPS